MVHLHARHPTPACNSEARHRRLLGRALHDGDRRRSVQANLPPGSRLFVVIAHGSGRTSGTPYGGRVALRIPAWRRALQALPRVRHGQWAVGGSVALALHGLPVAPRDVDVLADRVAVAELVAGLQGAIREDRTPWDRGDVRAARRVLAALEGTELEILVGVEAVSADGRVIMPTPTLAEVELVVLDHRAIPVLPLSTMRAVLEATGRTERAVMVRDALRRDTPRASSP